MNADQQDQYQPILSDRMSLRETREAGVDYARVICQVEKGTVPLAPQQCEIMSSALPLGCAEGPEETGPIMH